MTSHDWQRELRNSATDCASLPSLLRVTREEAAVLEEGGGLPFSVTPSYLALLCDAADRAERGDIDADGIPWAASYTALRRQVIPSPEERIVEPGELDDPLGEADYRASARLVHQYKNRCLLLSCGTCLSYCRHCFRRRYTERKEGFITAEELDGVCSYLAEHAEVEEILVSGGDPLCAGDSTLANLFDRLRAARPGILLRVCTRAPVFLPSRFTPELVALLRSYRPVWVIPHINHHAELSEAAVEALGSLIDAGIPVQSQTVLLRGVNDDVRTLKTLFTRLTRLGVKPGYLFQGDLAPGTAHLRVSIDEGLRLYAALRGELSGLSLPVYAVDLPGGGGKYNLIRLEDALSGNIPVRKADGWHVRTPDGREWGYPV